MTADLWTNRQHLQDQAYANSANLQARVSIYDFQEPKVELYRWALAHISWESVARVLDIGCGPGGYLQELSTRPSLELIGIDLSAGMLRDLRSRWKQTAVYPHMLCADVQQIPLATGSVDVALAMHMLYHVPNIPQALQELRRIVRPGGKLLALTNSADHVAEIFNLIADAIDAHVGTPIADRQPVIRRFRLNDAGLLLKASFGNVERRDVKAELRIPHVEPVLGYLNSTRASREPQLPMGMPWDAVLEYVARHVQTVIDSHGVFRVHTHSGVFICQ